MEERQLQKIDQATLVKKVCVLSGELLECYQWQEEQVDSTTVLEMIQKMKQTLQILENQIK